MNAILGPLAELSPEETQIEIDRALCRRSLAEFARRAWHVLEPPTQPVIWEWPHDAICEHLEAVSRGEITRLLMNVPPGSMKSLLTNVFWPAWEWGPCNMPFLRIIGVSHKLDLATRDAVKMNRLIKSDWYQARWGDRFQIVKDTEIKFETNHFGFRAAMPVTSVTGERGDRLNFDDPHSVDSAESDAERKSVVRTFQESLSSRLNNPDRSAIVVIMQRLHQEDVSGAILADTKSEYVHLCLPMEFEPTRRCTTRIGFCDPRTEDGELLMPRRFTAKAVTDLKRELHSAFAVAGQLQQRPEPRGGGILKRTSWMTWDADAAEALGVKAGRFPKFDFIVASADTAFTEKQENDPSALTIWGVFRDARAMPQCMLIYSWSEHKEFNDLVTKFEELCIKYRVDELWIEAKASGISVAQEIRRRMAGRDFRWSTILLNPGNLDKVARAYAVQGMLDDGMIWAPATRWADVAINQCAVFPKGSHDDIVDTVTQALNRLRMLNFLRHAKEEEQDIQDLKKHATQKIAPLYPA